MSLTIAGIAVPVARGAATETIERIGTSSRAYAGNLRSTVRSEKRMWKVTTTLLSVADAATLRTAVALAAQVSCAGTMLGSTVTCEVEVTDAPFVGGPSPDGNNFRRALSLTLREV